MTCGAALLMGEHRIQTVIGSAIVGVGFIVEALEHADFIWNHVPKKFADTAERLRSVATLDMGLSSRMPTWPRARCRDD